MDALIVPSATVSENPGRTQIPFEILSVSAAKAVATTSELSRAVTERAFISFFNGVRVSFFRQREPTANHVSHRM